ncbi:hypothetical protein AAC387_Pa09g0844 [Persea americana]
MIASVAQWANCYLRDSVAVGRTTASMTNSVPSVTTSVDTALVGIATSSLFEYGLRGYGRNHCLHGSND